jgi:hypothetical protein
VDLSINSMLIFHSYGDDYQRVNQRHHCHHGFTIHFNDLGIGKKTPRIHPRVRHFCWSCLGLKLLKMAMGQSQNPGTQRTQQKRAGFKGCWFHQIWLFHVISTRSPMKIPYFSPCRRATCHTHPHASVSVASDVATSEDSKGGGGRTLRKDRDQKNGS